MTLLYSFFEYIVFLNPLLWLTVPKQVPVKMRKSRSCFYRKL